LSDDKIIRLVSKADAKFEAEDRQMIDEFFNELVEEKNAQFILMKVSDGEEFPVMVSNMDKYVANFYLDLAKTEMLMIDHE
jgi:hypothetical protein